MMETFGSVTYCRTLEQGNHDRNPWFSTLLQQPSIKEIMIETLGSDLAVQYATEQRISIMISLVEGYCSQVQKQGFLS
jgi:hypothetical protein